MPQIFCSRVVILERLWKDIDFLWDGLVARFCRQSRGRKEGRKEISILRSPAGAVSWFSSKFHHVSLNQWYSSRKDPIASHRVFWGPIIVQINPAANKIYGKSIETASFFFPLHSCATVWINGFTQACLFFRIDSVRLCARIYETEDCLFGFVSALLAGGERRGERALLAAVKTVDDTAGKKKRETPRRHAVSHLGLKTCSGRRSRLIRSYSIQWQKARSLGSTVKDLANNPRACYL